LFVAKTVILAPLEVIKILMTLPTYMDTGLAYQTTLPNWTSALRRHFFPLLHVPKVPKVPKRQRYPFSQVYHHAITNAVRGTAKRNMIQKDGLIWKCWISFSSSPLVPDDVEEEEEEEEEE